MEYELTHIPNMIINNTIITYMIVYQKLEKLARGIFL